MMTLDTPEWLLADFDLSANNSFGLAARSRHAAVVTSEAQLAAVLTHARDNGLTTRVLGGGSNVVLAPEFGGLTVLIAITGKAPIERRPDALIIEAKAGENWHDFVVWTVSNQMPGLENLVGIPGTVGASPVQNIGAYGVELADRFHALTAFDTTTMALIEFDRAACRFGYRQSIFKQQPDRYIVTSVRFALPLPWRAELSYAGLASALDDTQRVDPVAIMDTVLAQRRSKLPDPAVTGNAGSFFHNPIVTDEVYAALKAQYPEAPAYPQADGRVKLSAGWLIERCGFKGTKHGAVGVSERHALVLVNNGGGTQAEIIALSASIKAEVLRVFGVQLAEEPIFF